MLEAAPPGSLSTTIGTSPDLSNYLAVHLALLVAIPPIQQFRRAHYSAATVFESCPYRFSQDKNQHAEHNAGIFTGSTSHVDSCPLAQNDILLKQAR
jgi:hypothetical protein